MASSTPAPTPAAGSGPRAATADAANARGRAASIPPAHFSFTYKFCAAVSRMFYRFFYRAEALGCEHVPANGPVIVVANHQSYLDPPLLGIFVRQRPFSFIARKGLFKFRPFAALIEALNAFPIDEDSGDIGAIRETLARLNAGHCVLIFPEGSRTPDGAMHEYKRGVALLVKKAKCPVVPAAVEGCFEAYPRGRSIRLFGARVAVKYGPAIAFDELMANGADAALDRLARETQRLRLELRSHLRQRTKGSFPPPGGGDSDVLGPLLD